MCCRFVLLEDCNHIIESGELEDYLNSIKGGIPRCPKCDVPIVKTMRCKSYYIKYRQQISAILQLIKDEHFRLKKIHSRNVDILKCKPTNNGISFFI